MCFVVAVEVGRGGRNDDLGKEIPVLMHCSMNQSFHQGFIAFVAKHCC